MAGKQIKVKARSPRWKVRVGTRRRRKPRARLRPLRPWEALLFSVAAVGVIDICVSILALMLMARLDVPFPYGFLGCGVLLSGTFFFERRSRIEKIAFILAQAMIGVIVAVMN